MNYLRKRMFIVIFAVFLLVQGSMSLMETEAKEAVSVPRQIECSYEKSPEAFNGVGLVIQNCPAKAKVKNLKSSNQKIVKVSWNAEQRDIINVDYYRTGKAKISFDLIYGKVKKHFTCKVIVKNYVNPCKSFKLGSKNYASGFSSKSQQYVTYKGTKKYKVSVKPAKGWKLQEILFYNNKTTKVIKNNSTVTCKSSWNYIAAYFYKPGTGEYQSNFIYLQK